MQRLKALVTGTLPTFVDAGANFGSSEIGEDNLLSQLQKHSRVLHFSGDDTWTNLFPSQFNVSHPYPSFNVQDLHTVDNGCIDHLFPALDELKANGNVSWDFFVAHFLGVDHVGHSFGPDTVPMAEKLTQVNGWLSRVFDSIDNDTLVVVIGDHGMDAKGDHGGDSENEVSAALFLYAKNLYTPSPELDTLLASLAPLEAEHKQQHETYLDTSTTYRSIQQIDIVPTLSVLLGVPIPFGNLGAAIPELLHVAPRAAPTPPATAASAAAAANLVEVARANARQMHTYLLAYSSARGAGATLDIGGSGSAALDSLFEAAERAYNATMHRGIDSGGDVAQMHAVYLQYMAFMRTALAAARRVWARFDVPLIILGVALFAAAVGFSVSAVAIWWRFLSCDCCFGGLWCAVGSFFVGAVIGAATAQYFGGFVPILVQFLPSDEGQSIISKQHEIILLSSIFGISSFCAATFIWSHMYHTTVKKTKSKRRKESNNLFSLGNAQEVSEWILSIVLLVLSNGVPVSDSYTIHEEAVTVYLLQTFGAYMLLASLNAKSIDIRRKLFAFTIVFMLLTRFSLCSTVCREEKAQTCIPTFNAMPNSSVASPLTVFALAVMIPVVLLVVRRSLNGNDGMRSSRHSLWLDVAVPCSLCASFVYWGLDALHGNNLFVGAWVFMKAVKVWWARLACFGFTAASLSLWWLDPFGSIGRQTSSAGLRRKEYFKFSGEAYLGFVVCVFAVLFTFQKPMGGVMLAVEMVQIVVLMEMHACLAGDSTEPGPSAFSDEKQQRHRGGDTKLRRVVLFTAVLHIVGQRYYFATGHQFTLSSIQWEVAFVGLFETSFVLGPAFMALNTFGGPMLAMAAVPLVGLWRRQDGGDGDGDAGARIAVRDAGAAVVAACACAGLWGFGATAMVGHFRRHLMVWSVFAPKFLGTDVGVVVLESWAIVVVGGLGLRRVLWDLTAARE